MHYYDIQGIQLTELADKFGTPLYVYDANKIIEKIGILRDSFKDVNIKIKYACKANTNLSILKLMRKHGVEIDVVSPEELRLALMAGYEGHKLPLRQVVFRLMKSSWRLKLVLVSISTIWMYWKLLDNCMATKKEL
jgi:diaminopimelate decarboxylase